MGKGPLHRNSHSGPTCISQLAQDIPDLLHLSSGYQDGEFMVPHGCSQGLLRVCTAAFLQVQTFFLQAAQLQGEGGFRDVVMLALIP